MRVLPALFSIFLATVASAEGNFEITPTAGYRFGGDFAFESGTERYEVDEASSFGLILNLRDRARTQWELFYSQQASVAELDTPGILLSSVSIDFQTLQLGGTYQGEGGQVRPYVALTVGGTRVDTGQDDDYFWSGSLGVGLQLFPESRVGLRLEARAHGVLTDSGTDLFCATGPDQNICAVRVSGELFSQFETFAGLVIRF